MCTEKHHHHHSHHDEEHTHHGEAIILQKKKLEIERNILSGNDIQAQQNRGYLEAKNIYCVNMVSSPGSGKTTILEETVKILKTAYSIGVIEGDQHTTNDAERIKALNVPSIQINTHEGCHLEALTVNKAIKELNLPDNSLLFIENVGNLVCPAMFDLGENLRVVVLSVTEGDDKPLKYPYMFERAQVCLINKIDLLPHLKSNVEKIKENAKIINPHIQFIELSAQTGAGIEQWCNFLKKRT